MPNLSWDEISNLKHILQQGEAKLAKDAKYLRGLVDMIDTIVGEHEDE